MIPRHLIRLLITTGLVTIALPCHSQNVSKVDLQFVSFPRADNPEPLELLIGGGETLNVELPTNRISSSYNVPSLKTWTLGKSSADANGKITFQAYGTAQSIGANEQLILVTRKGASNSDGLDLVALKGGNEGFSGGKYLLMNASRVDIAGSIGTGQFALRPREHRLIAPNPTKTNDGRQYAFAKFYFRMNETIQPFFSSTWRFNTRARSMVFFYHDPTTEQLRVHTIRSSAP